MNNSYQAKNGLKTFTFAMVISLVVFAIFYYLTSYPKEAVDIERHSEEHEQAVLQEARKTTFEKLANEKVAVPSRAVLAGADVSETTESTGSVPTTGVFSITMALITASIAFAVAGYVIYLGPRNLALSKFEKTFFD